MVAKAVDEAKVALIFGLTLTDIYFELYGLVSIAASP